jgi:predicted MFS family arabinose efflux permease
LGSDFLVAGLVVEFVIQVIGAGVNLSHSMIFLELLQPESKYSATAIYSMVMNVGAFLGPLAGVALADRIGIVPTLLIGAGLRLAGAFLFHIYPVKTTVEEKAAAS